MNDSGSTTPQPLRDEHLAAALPTLQAIDERLGRALLPSVTVPSPTALSAGLWQTAKALHLLLDALDSGTGPQQAPLLTGACDALENAGGELRQARADLLYLQDLIAEELEEQTVSADLGLDAIANSLDLKVSLPSGRPARIQISIDPHTGRTTWSTPDFDLGPIGGRRQLDLTTAVRRVGETITGALPPTASISRRAEEGRNRDTRRG